MLIEVPCPKCQHIIKINVKKVEVLQARIKELESSLELYRSGSSSSFSGFDDLFRSFKK